MTPEARELTEEELKGIDGGIHPLYPCDALDNAPDNQGIDTAESETECEVRILE